jgi:hypothetical protein
MFAAADDLHQPAALLIVSPRADTGPGPSRRFSEAGAGSRAEVGLAPAQVVRPGMWIDVVIVALLLGACALLKRADWRTRFLARIRTAGSPWVTAAHDARDGTDDGGHGESRS